MNSERTIPDPERDPEAWRAYWLKQIEAAQEQRSYEIEGERYDRIPYGKESSDVPPCHDCDVVAGQYHVPGCDSETCPKCGRRAVSCECAYFPGDSEIYSS